MKRIRRSGAKPGIFQGREVFRNKGTSTNISSTTHEKKASQGKTLEFILLDSLKTAFQMRKLTHRWTQAGRVFPKSGQYFPILKKEHGRLPSPPTSFTPEYWVEKNCAKLHCRKSLRIVQKSPWNWHFLILLLRHS